MEAIKSQQPQLMSKLTREEADKAISEMTPEKAFKLVESIIDQNIKSGNFAGINDVLVINGALDVLKASKVPSH